VSELQHPQGWFPLSALPAVLWPGQTCPALMRPHPQHDAL
jgi:hypothetical protein